MIDLIGFLTDRLDEDEAAAQTATNGDGQWLWTHDHGNMCNDPDCSTGQLVDRKDNVDVVLMDVHAYDIHAGWQGATHIARWDPARVLTEVQTKRHIIDRHWDKDGFCAECGSGTEDDGPSSPGDFYPVRFPCQTLRLLALPFDTHPEYREEWQS